MSRRRRHADDFTDLLNSFQYTTSSEIDSDTLYSISQDSLDEIKGGSNHTSNDTQNSKHSTILAGSSTKKHSLAQNLSVSSVTLPLSVQFEPDLNARINSFQAEHSCNKIDDNKENNPQSSLKDEQLENDIMFKKITNVSMLTPSKKHVLRTKLENNITNENSKRDTNYNIHDGKSVISASEENVLKSISESQYTPLLNYTSKDKHKCDISYEHKHVNNEAKKFETIICTLDNQLNQMKETSQSQKVLKRLSNRFAHAPNSFTERLLSIIEESVINNDEDSYNTSAMNLSRLTMEFRKMCKFIEDESAPEWAPSLICTPPDSKEVPASPVGNKSNHNKTCKAEKSLHSPINMPAPTTPISGIDIIKKRFFSKISKNNFSGSVDNVANMSVNETSNASFEHLEAQCKRLFPEEKECSKHLRRSLSVPALLSMNQIQSMCEQQMALLNDCNTINENHKENTILSNPNLLDKYLYKNPINKSESDCSNLQQRLYNKAKSFQHDNISYSKKKSKRIYKKSDTSKVKSDKISNGYVTIDPDELEKTLLQDIAEKRKRCLDTARLITEINADHEIMEVQKSLGMSPLFVLDNESNSLTNDEAKFLKTLMSCRDYQTYLEKQKPLLKILKNSNPCTPESTFKNSEKSDLQCEVKNTKKENLNIKTPSTINTLSTNVKSYSPYKSPSSKKKNEEKEKKKENIKPILFVTPGKTPPNKNCKKKIYFPSMNSPVKTPMEKHILKSPHIEGLYRLNYNTIISPVGMYIRGTDMQLIKNVRAKTDGLLLTPVKKNVKISPNKNSKQNTPSKDKPKNQEKVSLKINLSPKLEMNHAYEQKTTAAKMPENDNMAKKYMELPKVSYQLPLQVKTIKENKSPKQGTRVKKLLESAQSKVVIRHQGRVNSVQKQKNSTNDGIYEIRYEPEDESIHIEQAANKTNFIHRRKNI